MMLTNKNQNQNLAEIKKVVIKEMAREFGVSLRKALYNVLLVGPIGASAFAIYLDSKAADAKGFIGGSIVAWLALLTIRSFLPIENRQHDRMFTSKLSCLFANHLNDLAKKMGVKAKAKEVTGICSDEKYKVASQVKLSANNYTADNNRFLREAKGEAEKITRLLKKKCKFSVDVI